MTLRCFAPCVCRSPSRAYLLAIAIAAATAYFPRTAVAENGDVLRISELLVSAGPSDLTFAPDAGSGTVWVSTRLDGKIYGIDSQLAELTATIDNPHGTGVIPDFILTYGIAYRESSETLFVLAQDGPQWFVRELGTDGTEVEDGSFELIPPDPDSSRLRGLTYDGASQALWTLDIANDLVVRFDMTGTITRTLLVPGDDPAAADVRGDGVAYSAVPTPEGGLTSRLYVAHGDLFRSGPGQLIQIHLNGTESGVHLPLLDVPGVIAGGFTVFRQGMRLRAMVLTGAGEIVEVEHTLPEIAAPAWLTCTLTPSNQVSLEWKNRGAGFAGAYGGEVLVTRNGLPLATVPGSRETFLDTSPKEGVTSYTVSASEERGGTMSPESFPCEVTVGAGGIVRWAPITGNTVFDIARNPASGEIFTTDNFEGTIQRYDSSLAPIGELPSPWERPGGICYLPRIDIPNLGLPGQPPFTTFTDLLAVAQMDGGLVALISAADGARVTTLSLNMPSPDARIGGLSYVADEQQLMCVELEARDILVFGADGRLKSECFPRFPPPGDGVPLETGVAFDPAQQTILSAFGDGHVRELFAEVDGQGGCVVTDFEFALEGLGEIFANPEAFGGVEVSDNTLLIAGREQKAIFQVLLHPFFTVLFRRGDANRDDGVNIADVLAILEYLFGDSSLKCLDAADVDDNGAIDINDPVRLLFYLFQSGPAPSPPFEEPATDPTFRGDNLSCAE